MFKCFLDMDGVLADLHLGIITHLRIPETVIAELAKPLAWDWVEAIAGGAHAGVWKELPESFWASLPWTPEGRRILELAEARFGERVYILTNPSESAAAVAGKYRWIREHVPHLLPRTYFGADKGGLAGDGKLLVDDGEHNIRDFEEHGGHGILVPRMWNRLHRHEPMPYVERRLAVL